MRQRICALFAALTLGLALAMPAQEAQACCGAHLKNGTPSTLLWTRWSDHTHKQQLPPYTTQWIDYSSKRRIFAWAWSRCQTTFTRYGGGYTFTVDHYPSGAGSWVRLSWPGWTVRKWCG